MAKLTQSDRRARLDTALGPDALLFSKLTGNEELSGDFEWRIEAISEDPAVDLNKLLGNQATVSADCFSGHKRYFNGIVTEAAALGNQESGNVYSLVLRPWLFVAGLRRNQRIFHEMTVVEIVQEVFSAYAGLGSPHFEFAVVDDYPTLEYTVQYGETDADFCRRLLERFGISWYWEQTAGNHKMVLTDQSKNLPDIGERPFYGMANTHLGDSEHIRLWEPRNKMTVGAVRLNEYNFKKPSASQEVDQAWSAPYKNGDMESVDWPGDYLEQSEGRGVVQRRVDEEVGQGPRVKAEGNVLSLYAGAIMTLSGDEVPGQTGNSFICLKINHNLRSQSYSTGKEISDDDDYSCSMVLTPEGTPFRLERRTAIPRIYGPQMATVVGEGEIDCDDLGRILVHFPWDLDSAISMRCRVSQNWAGKGWGGMVIPRIGMEVLVEFVEGDPDKPVVTGCVYNGRNDPPYPLPDNKTKSVFRSDTHKGQGFNELMFEDEKDDELIYMHGQKDHQINILNDRRKDIGHDQSEAVGNDKSITVGNDHAEAIGRDAEHTVGRDVMYTVGQNQIEKYGKDHVHKVGNIHKQDIYADHLVSTGRDHKETVKGEFVLDVNKAITNNTTTHTLMASQKFVIKGPGGKITIDAGGITLEAVKINLKGMVAMGGSGSAQVPTLKGAANDGLPLVEECPEE